MTNGKRAQQLSVNFLVKFILAVVMFGLGVILMWSIYDEGESLISLPQGEINKRIEALNCKPTEPLCLGSGSITVSPGDQTVVGVKVFNNLRVERDFELSFELRDENNALISIDDDSLIRLKPKKYLVTVSPQGDSSLGVATVVSKSALKGAYSIRVVLKPADGDLVVRRINLFVK